MWTLVVTTMALQAMTFFTPTSAWDTSYDQAFQYSCHNNQALSRIRSQHHNGREDRVFDFECRGLPVQATLNRCTWTNYVNNFDEGIGFMCPSNKVMVGINSYHSNSKEDRRYKFLCCKASNLVSHSCSISPFVNNFDRDVDFRVPNDKVLTGMVSYHSNGAEDRRFKFITCSLAEL